jgi:hypothetical protein
MASYFETISPVLNISNAGIVNLAHLDLPAGTWDVDGRAYFYPASANTNFATLDTSLSTSAGVMNYQQGRFGSTTSLVVKSSTWGSGPYVKARFVLNAAGTIYLANNYNVDRAVDSYGYMSAVSLDTAMAGTGRFQNKTGTILAGTSLSNVIDLSAGRPIVLHMPVDWTPARLSFQVSPDGVNFNDLFDNTSREITFNIMPKTSVYLTLHPITYIKIRSGGRDNPVVQKLDRIFNILVDTSTS